ncbi:MAG: hypothetical protein ACRDD1_14430 [Planctomycetia bacterium]
MNATTPEPLFNTIAVVTAFLIITIGVGILATEPRSPEQTLDRDAPPTLGEFTAFLRRMFSLAFVAVCLLGGFAAIDVLIGRSTPADVAETISGVVAWCQPR